VNNLALQLTIAACGIAALAGMRSWLARRGAGDAFFRALGYVEMAAVTVLIAGLVFFGVLQIILRNFFREGIIWADPLMRHIVLWLGCLGGTLASARMKHINIDVLTRILPAGMQRARDRIVFGATAAATAALGVAALKLVLDEKSFGETSFLNIHTWMLQAILPFAFFLISYRSACQAMAPPGDRVDPAVMQDDGREVPR
jgi:TRAP-type C4-dicarboxylate transport system permease small subunit